MLAILRYHFPDPLASGYSDKRKGGRSAFQLPAHRPSSFTLDNAFRKAVSTRLYSTSLRRSLSLYSFCIVSRRCAASSSSFTIRERWTRSVKTLSRHFVPYSVHSGSLNKRPIHCKTLYKMVFFQLPQNSYFQVCGIVPPFLAIVHGFCLGFNFFPLPL